jgi:hypothetical protein
MLAPVKASSSLFRAAALGSLAALVVGCGGAPPAPIPRPTAKAAPTATPPESPARWIARPHAPQPVVARYELGDAGVLFVTGTSLRILERKDGSRAIASAPLFADVVGVLRRDDGSFLAVDDGGRVLPFADALARPGAPRPSGLPNARLVTVGARAIVAVDASGQVQRSIDGGASYAPVSLPPFVGEVSSLRLRADGKGLLLVSPQRLFVTNDDGASWTPIATPSIGARRVNVDGNGDLVLEGLIGAAALREAPQRMEKIGAPAASASIMLSPGDAEPPSFAEGFAEGRAVFDGARVLNLAHEEASGWTLTTYELGGIVARRRIAELDAIATGNDPTPVSCETARLAVRGKHVFVGCERDVGLVSKHLPRGQEPYQSRVLVLFASADGGNTFRAVKIDGAEGLPLDGGLRVQLFALDDGSVIVEGGCKPARTLERCAESSPVVVSASGIVRISDAPGLHLGALGAFGPSEGRSLVAIGLDDHERSVALISNDGGHAWKTRTLPLFAKSAEAPSDDRSRCSAVAAGAAVGDDGRGHPVIIAHTSCHGAPDVPWLRFVSLDDGASWSVAALSVNPTLIDLAGRRGVAVDDDGGLETADGGLTFHRFIAPRLEGYFGDAERGVTCSAYGCLIGDDATRVGWDHDGPGDYVPPSSTAAAASKPEPAKAGYRCVADGTWSRLGDYPMPDAADADRGGGTRWTSARRDDDGRVEIIVESSGKSGPERKTITLFGAGGPDVATTVSAQFEGYAAARFSFKREPPPKPTPPAPTPPKGTKPTPPSPPPRPRIAAHQSVDLEIAWYRADTGKVRRGIIKDFGPIEPGTSVRDGGKSATADLFLSIADKGIFARAQHDTSRNDGVGALYFLGDDGKVEKVAFPALPRSERLGARLDLAIDAARVDGRTVVFGRTAAQYGYDLVAAWADAAGFRSTDWSLRTRGLGRVGFIESGPKPVLAVSEEGPRLAHGTAYAFVLDAPSSEPNVLRKLPTQDTLPDVLPGCASGESRPWRYFATALSGSARPVTLDVDGATLKVTTGRMMMRGGPTGDFCVSAVDTQGVVRSGDRELRALIDPQELGRSVLFGHSGAGKDSALSVRPLRCELAR